MPIIGRNDSIQGEVAQGRAPRYGAPDISAFPDYDNAKNAATVGAVGTALTDAGIRRSAIDAYERRRFEAEMKKKQDIADQLQDENLISEAAIKLQLAQEDAKNAPQQIRKGVKLTEGDPGGLDEPSVTTALVPRSDTVLPDYEKRQASVISDVTNRAGGALRPRLALGLERLTRQSTMAMQKHASDLKDDEAAASTLDGVRMKATAITATKVPAPVDNENMVPVYNPDADRSYFVLRQGVVDDIDRAQSIGAISPKRAETMKGAELARIDHSRATQAMLADPEKWLAAGAADTNGWAERLTPEKMLALDTKAGVLTKRREEGKNALRLERQRTVTQDFLARVQPGAEFPLTVKDVVDAASVDRSIDGPTAEHWIGIVKGIAAGGWDDEPDLAVKMRLEAGNFGVQPSFEARVNAMVGAKRLSIKSGEEMKNTARSIITKRNDVAQTEDFKIFSSTQTAMNTMLTTSPLLGAKMDQESWTLRGNAQAALLDHAMKNGFGSAHQWWKENQDRFVGGLSDRVDSEVDVLNNSLPTPIQKDPKTRLIRRTSGTRSTPTRRPRSRRRGSSRLG
jgi:hypothetical protein